MNKSMGKKVFRGTITIVLVGILAKITSFIAEAILAAYLGTTYQSDAYYMVASIQNVIYPMLSIGIWKVFLPLYKSHMAKGETDTAYALTNKSLSFFYNNIISSCSCPSRVCSYCGFNSRPGI